jgi:ATP-dependent Clp protease ATP-binding subunit ClpB
MLVERQLTIELSQEARTHLVKLGYEPALGARPLKRVLLKALQDPLAEAVLSARFAPNTKIRITLAGEALAFEPA